MQASLAPHAPMRQLLPRHRPAALLHGATGSLAFRAHSTHKARCVVQPLQALPSPAHEKDTTSTRTKMYCDTEMVAPPKSGELQAPSNDGAQPKAWILLAALSAAMMAMPLNAGAAQLATSTTPIERSVMSSGITNTAPENGSDSVPKYTQRQYDEAAREAREARIQEVSAAERAERTSFFMVMISGAVSAAWFWFLFRGLRQEVEPAATAAAGARRKGTTTTSDVELYATVHRQLALFLGVYIGLIPLRTFWNESLELFLSLWSHWL